MVVPGSSPVIQQEPAIDPDLGLGSTENCPLGVDMAADCPDQGGPELEEVRKLQQLVRRLEIQNQQLRTRGKGRQSGLNAPSHTHSGMDNHNSPLQGMEINNSLNTNTEKRELQILSDHPKPSNRTEKENIGCLRASLDSQQHYEDVSSNPKMHDNAEVFVESVKKGCPASPQRTSSSEFVDEFYLTDFEQWAQTSDLELCEDSDSLGATLDDTALDEVDVLELETLSEDEDCWLYVSPQKCTAARKPESPLQWCRQVLDHHSPGTETACRTLISRIDQASRWKSLYCSPLPSPSAPQPNTEASTCSNALNSPGYLKSTNKSLLTCGSSGYLSVHSALSSQSSVDSELSTSDDSISMGYKLQDLTDVQVMARLQEESLRQDYASSSASVSRRSSSASMHSLRRGTYSDQEFDTHSLEDEDDYDCSLSFRSSHRYSPSPLSSPRCQSPSATGDFGKCPTSRIRPPRRTAQNPAQDRMKFNSSEEEMRHSLPNLTRTSLRSLDAVRSSRSLESDLQVPNSRLTRIQQPGTGIGSNKLRYPSSAGQPHLIARQPMKVPSSASSLTTRQPLKSSGYGSSAGTVRRVQAPACLNPSPAGNAPGRAASITSSTKNSPLRIRTLPVAGTTTKSKISQSSRRPLPPSKTGGAPTDDSWKDGCY
ncbi:SLAIN motif-containing protein-like isoform X1 [Ambystoma mexicanum]|uniref:SLAIN motif-containing protein-like isoform X1 n=1 Tax=Ambystoma mexicanum TaxID=8296 RepID=UPI0037E8B212